MLLYDGVCNLCNGWVNFVLDRDPNSRYKFAALQGEAGKAMMKRVGKGQRLSHACACGLCLFPEPVLVCTCTAAGFKIISICVGLRLCEQILMTSVLSSWWSGSCKTLRSR